MRRGSSKEAATVAETQTFIRRLGMTEGSRLGVWKKSDVGICLLKLVCFTPLINMFPLSCGVAVLDHESNSTGVTPLNNDVVAQTAEYNGRKHTQNGN